MRRGEVFTGFLLRDPKGRHQWEDLGIRGRITLRWNLGRQRSIGRIEFGWLMIESGGGLL
jgi:hypothetical protein